MVSVDIEKLVDEYAESIIMQRRAIEEGNTEMAKRYGKKRGPIAKRLIEMGDIGKEHFASLLFHNSRQVRGTAAVHLISTMPEEALAVLRDLAEGDDLVALGAQMRIKEWEEHPEHYDQSNWV